VWLAGREQPLVLNLRGNCWRDLAGRRCAFTNPSPQSHDRDALAEDQTGVVGDITASRKVRVPGLPLNEWLELRRRGEEAPEHWGNALYLEWYSDLNGRVVVESADYDVEVSLPEWQMSDAEEHGQREENGEAMNRFLDRLEASLAPAGPVDVPEDRPMDEHEWEQFLKESDARTERLGELLDKFDGHPDRERIVAHHMGWDHIEAMLEAERSARECDEVPWEDAWDMDDPEEWEPPEPNPDREGIDWIRDERGELRHPLQHRCSQLALRMFFEARDQGLDCAGEGDRDEDVALMNFKMHCVATKLAGGLSGIAEGMPPEPGFVIATLKRALTFLNEALSAMDSVEAKGNLREALPGFRAEVLQVRNDMIDTMERLREDPRKP
jgi:hypothetical protein